MKKRINAFGYAFTGLFMAIREETHLKVHLIAMIFVTFLGYYFRINNVEWLVIVICCGLVIAAELFNTAIEKSCDLITKEWNREVKYIKDVSAAGVLVLSVVSIIISYLIFMKYL